MIRQLGLIGLGFYVVLGWAERGTGAERPQSKVVPQESAVEAAALRMMTFNIRYGTAADGANAWPLRRELLFDVVRQFNPDVLGVQEALRGQLDELVQQFPNYLLVGAGREADGSGEYSSIFLRRTRFDLWGAETFWLSDTPAQPGSTSWGNQLPRICTWVHLLDRQTGHRFYVFNTHWDHQSQPAREGAGRLIAKRVSTRQAREEPVVVMGDFNVDGKNAARAPLAACGLRDSFHLKHAVDSDNVRGMDVGTLNHFGAPTSERKIDAILVTPHWHVLDAAIDRTKRNGRYPSDHFPVTAILTLRDVENLKN